MHFNKKVLIKTFFFILIFSVSVGIILAGIYLKGNRLETLLYYARVPLKDGSTLAVKRCLAFCIPTVILLAVGLNILAFGSLCTRKFFAKKKIFDGNGKLFRTLLYFYKRGYILSVFFLIASVLFLGSQIDAYSYIGGAIKTTKVYDEEYTPPQKQIYKFPEKKKNLIYIFCESMETSYASAEEGGLMEENYIPYLTQLAKENISFSDTNTLGGAFAAPGTTWTAAAMVAQTSGIPLTIPMSKSNFGDHDRFLPGAFSIGQILENAGYNQELMVGSKATFAKRRDYFEQHGNYQIFDYYTAVERGLFPPDYYVWWGFEDQKLFQYARDEITNLYNQGQPFNFTMLTVDTHFTDGYVCEQCLDTFDNQYANVINCSDRQIYAFVDWIKQQPFYKDTVIVISGDHLTMDNHYFDSIDEATMERGRRVYNCFINTGLSDEFTKNRTFTTLDMFPTTLASLGITWGKQSLALGVNLFSGQNTLSEKMGYDKFSGQLASSSNFYSDYIIDKNILDGNEEASGTQYMGASAEYKYSEATKDDKMPDISDNERMYIVDEDDNQ